MFEFLRKGATSIFAKVFLAVIVIVFIFWGIGSFATSEKDLLAKIGDQKVSLREFQEFYHYNLIQIRQALGDISEEDLKKMNFKEQVLKELLQKKLLEIIAKDLGIKVTAEELRIALGHIALFQERGEFNESKYKAFLREIGLSASSFEKLIYSQLLEEKIKNLITAPLILSKDEVKDFANFYFQELELEEYILPFEDCEREVKFTEEDLENFFHAHRDRYVEEEKVKLAYLKLPIQGEIEISEEELKNYYSQNLVRFREPFKVKLRKFFVPGLSEISYKKAEEFREKLKTLKDFDKLGVNSGEWFEEESLPSEYKDLIKTSKMVPF